MPQYDETHEGNSGIGRRDFLRRAAAIGAGLTAAMAGGAGRALGAEQAGAVVPAAGAAGASLEHRNERPDIAYRRLGRTNLAVSALTFGAIQLEPGNLRIMASAVGRGINLVHINLGYKGGKAIRTLGDWIKKQPGNRNKVYIALKADVGGFDEELRIMNTDHIDLLMVPLDDPNAVLDENRPKKFDELKKAGKVRFLGLTYHSNDRAVMENGLRANWFDVFLPAYNGGTRKDLKPLIPEAKQKDIGLLAMKSTGGIHGDPVATWRTFLDDGIDSVLRTLTNDVELGQAMRLTKKTAHASAALPTVDLADQCTLCGACDACPSAVAIQDTLRTYQYYVGHRGWTDTARAQYAEIPAARRVSACGDCGRCEVVCPQNLAVRQLMRQAHEALV